MRAVLFAAVAAYLPKPVPLSAQYVYVLPASPLATADGMRATGWPAGQGNGAENAGRSEARSLGAYAFVMAAAVASLAVAGEPIRRSRVPTRSAAPMMLTDDEYRRYMEKQVMLQKKKLKKDAERQKQASGARVAVPRGTETPAQTFERLVAPFYIPPQVATKRPELVKKYQPDTKSGSVKVQSYQKSKAPAASKVATSDVQVEKERAQLVAEEAERRRQFDKMVEANKKQKEKDLALENKRYAAEMKAMKKSASRKASPSPVKKAPAKQTSFTAAGTAQSVETPAQAFERTFAPIYIPPSVATQRPELVKKYQPSSTSPKKKAAVQNKTAKAAAMSKASTVKKAPTERTSSSAAEASQSGETPAQAFERTFAPLYIPPAVAKQRPELVKKYQASSTSPEKKGAVQKTVTKARATKTAAKNPSRTRPTSKKAPASPRGVVKPTKVGAAAKNDTESPVEIFERVAGSIWIPPNRKDLREKLGKK